MHRIIAAAVAAGICASSLQAQTSPPVAAGPTFTLADALVRAGVSSIAQEAAAANIRAAEAQRRVAGLRPNPSIDVQTENVAGTGIYQGMRSSETTAGLSLPLELGGKRDARVAVANAQLDRAGLEAEVARADMRLRVTQAYNEAAAAQRRLEVARDQARIAVEVLRGARVRVASGRASPLEEQRADVARIAAEGSVERAERTASVTTANLGLLIGGSVGALDLAWFDQIDMVGSDRPVASGSTLAAAAAQADVSVAEARVRLGRSQRIPDLTVSASARRLEQTNDVAAVFGVSVPLTIFNAGRAAVDVSSAQRDQADALRRMALLDAERSIASARAEVANAATTARNASGPALAAATEAARIARIGYREGKFGQLDLLDAERTLAETRAAAIDALATYHDAQARLDRLTTSAYSKEGDQ
ncbi:TolC family protein [Sphingobium aromaticiconvertens]|uniref:TolC family protein n=1 Tax=Sphingobium aromaticiconvertens TaxID=365341 RepID=UPI003015F8B9